MKTSQLKDILLCDTLSKKGEVFTARKGFFYRHGYDENQMAQSIACRINENTGNKFKAIILEQGEKWRPFQGGQTCAQGSHWWVKFRVEPNDELIEVINCVSGLPCKIRACDAGTCVDPSQERFWSM